MNNSQNASFANLSQVQLDQIKKTESQLNSAGGNAGEEIILLAYTKPEKG